MASTTLDSRRTAGHQEQDEKKSVNDLASGEKLASIPGNDSEMVVEYATATEDLDHFTPHHDKTHRRLRPRHIQLIGIGGCVHMSHHQSKKNWYKHTKAFGHIRTIGTALYVQIGTLIPVSMGIKYAHYSTGRSLTQVICVVRLTGSPR